VHFTVDSGRHWDSPRPDNNSQISAVRPVAPCHTWSEAYATGKVEANEALEPPSPKLWKLGGRAFSVEISSTTHN
jgi:hypothetical protein